MVWFNFSHTLIFVLLIRTSTCSSPNNCLFSHLRSKVLSHLPNAVTHSQNENREVNTSFGRLVALITENASKNRFVPNVVKAISHDPEREKFGSAATIMLAMVLSNGLVEPSDCEALRSVENGLANDGNTIATILAKYVVPVFNKDLIQQYQRRIKSGYGPVQSLRSAMEDIQHVVDADERLDIQISLMPKRQAMGCGPVKYDASDIQIDKRTFIKKRWANDYHEPIRFSGDYHQYSEFNTFVKVLFEEMSAIKKAATYNDVDQLLIFISEYKDQTQRLEAFYQTYNYKFRPSEDTSVAALLNFFETVERKQPFAKAASFFVTAFNDIAVTGKEVPEDDFLGHVAGVYEIRLKERRGYILIDLFLGVHVPIILMEDGLSPRQDTAEVAQHVIKFNLLTLENHGRLVQAKVFDEDNQSKLTSILNYFVTKPYCAFFTETYKPKLVIPFHGMLSREEDVSQKAQLNFEIVPKDPKQKLKGDYSFRIISSKDRNRHVSPTEKFKASPLKFVYSYLTSTDDFCATEETILFRDLFNMTANQTHALTTVAQDLGLTPSSLWGKLVAVKLLILNDQDLLEQLENNDKGLNIGAYFECVKSPP